MNKQDSLNRFRSMPEKQCGEWRYRCFGTGIRTILLLPGGELVNDLGFSFALSLSQDYRILYPAYPRAESLEELADGLVAILDREGVVRASLLGASFGGAVAQVFVRRHRDRVRDLILSNTGVPLQRLTGALRVTYWIAKVLPWGMLSKLLRRTMLKAIRPPVVDLEFWNAYLDELFSRRLAKHDVLENLLIQFAYHSRLCFSSEDLKSWSGRVLIAESDSDIIGPSRRKLLRETYPSAGVHTFHDAGHAPMFTQADEYLKVIKTFLDGG
jgi:pimeloyl-ACP methyl ester carboxylesterase